MALLKSKNPMFYMIVSASCLLAWWLAKDAIKGQALCLDDENPDPVD